jgi:hypothetical protein
MDDGSIYRRQERLMAFLQPWHIMTITLICVLGGAATKFEVSPHQLDGPEALASADIAREITSGRGFNTRVLTPLSLSYTNIKGVSAPDVEYPPLFSIVLATLAFAIRPTAGAAAAVSAILNVLTAASLFYWARRLTSDLRVACVAATAYGLSPLALDCLVAARPSSLAALLVTNLTLWLISYVSPKRVAATEAAAKRPWLTPLLLGALCGLAALTDYRLAFLAPIIAVAVWRCRQEAALKAAATFMLGVVVVLVPWGLRNLHVTGSPFFSLYWARALVATGTFPGLSLYCRSLTAGETIGGLVFGHLRDVLALSYAMLGVSVSATPSHVGAAFFALALAGFCARLIPARTAGILLATLATLLVTAALWARNADGMLTVVPLLAYVGSVSWVTILDRLSPPPPEPQADTIALRPMPTQRFHVLAFLVLAFVATLSAVPWRPTRATPLRDVMALSELLRRASDPLPRCTMTDIPWDLTWYTGAVTCALPVGPEQVAEVNKRIACPVIVLSSAVADLRPDSYLSSWHWAGIKPEVLPDYRLVHRSPVAVLLLQKDFKLGGERGAAPRAAPGGPVGKG